MITIEPTLVGENLGNDAAKASHKALKRKRSMKHNMCPPIRLLKGKGIKCLPPFSILNK